MVSPFCLLFLAASLSAPAELEKALAYEQKGDAGASIQALEALIRSRPTWELPRLELTRLLLKSGAQLPRAEAHLEVAASLAPENPRVHYLAGLVQEERQAPERALAAYARALEYRPTYEDARLRLAGLSLMRGDAVTAEQHYRFLANRHPEQVQLRLQLAEALEALGRPAEAEKELVQLSKRRPVSPLVLRRLVTFYERSGREDKAQQVQQRLAPPPTKKMRSLKPSRR